MFRIFLLVVLLFPANSSWACIGAFDETRTFLGHLPETESQRASSAKIRILSIDKDQTTREKTFNVIVIEGIRGINEGHEFKIPYHRETSCSGDTHVEVGEEYYVSGELNSRNEFYGIWRGPY